MNLGFKDWHSTEKVDLSECMILGMCGQYPKIVLLRKMREGLMQFMRFA